MCFFALTRKQQPFCVLCSKEEICRYDRVCYSNGTEDLPVSQQLVFATCLSENYLFCDSSMMFSTDHLIFTEQMVPVLVFSTLGIAKYFHVPYYVN